MVQSKPTIPDRRTTVLVTQLEALQSVATGISALQGALVGIADAIAEAISRDPDVRMRKWPVYLREWRESRGRTLGDLAKAVDLSVGQLSRIERGHQSYNQEVLEGYAEALGCRPADLISRLPYRPENALQPLLGQLRAVRSRQSEVV